MKHEHSFIRVIANRPGLATLQCGCKKTTLATYDTAGQLADLLADLKTARAAAREHYDKLRLRLEALRSMGLRRGEIAAVVSQEVPA